MCGGVDGRHDEAHGDGSEHVGVVEALVGCLWREEAEECEDGRRGSGGGFCNERYGDGDGQGDGDEGRRHAIGRPCYGDDGCGIDEEMEPRGMNKDVGEASVERCAEMCAERLHRKGGMNEDEGGDEGRSTDDSPYMKRNFLFLSWKHSIFFLLMIS